MVQQEKQSFWQTVPGVLAGIGGIVAAVAALITATGGFRTGLGGGTVTSQVEVNPNGAGKANSVTPEPPPKAFSDNWAGTWTCVASDHEMQLFISGQGLSSSLRGTYEKAYGDKPAREEYTVRNVTANEASGDYLYFDSNPNVGFDGRAGVWKGTWSITFDDPVLRLVRADTTSGWRGQYQCRR